MKQVTFIFLVFLCCQSLAGQDKIITTDSTSNKILDKLYKEDQFFLGFTYNLLNNMPKNMSQNGFSTGLSLGYIKDIPLNESRNFGLGIGLGLASNSINHNLQFSKVDGELQFKLLDADEFTKNKLATQLIELPLEIRWRTSSPETYKFWRVYAGIKLGYIIASKSKFKGGGESFEYSNIEAIEKVRYGLTLSAGYSTWNINLYYGLNPILKEGRILNGDKMEARIVKIGLIFYLL